ncbi:hypothetical protein [Rhodococcus oxybenzonivorans]|nr:hypothetical protein [Rhodococcus oxybenzonivorans]
MTTHRALAVGIATTLARRLDTARPQPYFLDQVVEGGHNAIPPRLQARL